MSARGGRQRAAGERVEMLDSPEPDQALWSTAEPPTGDGPALVPASPSRRRGRIVLGAAGAVVAILVVANLLSDTGSRSNTAPTSTSAAPTTVRPTTTTPSTEVPTSSGPSISGSTSLTQPTIVVDLPPGYSLAYADRSGSGFDPTPMQLWANWSTDPAAGSWLWLTMYPGDGWSSGGESRVWLRHGVGLLSHNPDGTVRLDVNRGDAMVAIVANGVSVDSLAAVADSVQVRGNRITDEGAIGGLGLRLLAETDGADGSPVASTMTTMSIVSTADPSEWINVATTGSSRPFDRAVRTFLLREPQAMTLGGRNLAVVGIDGRWSGVDQFVAVVDVDGTEVEVTGSDRGHVIDVASGLRSGTDAEWDELRSEAHEPQSNDDYVPADLGRGSMRTGEAWHAQLIFRPGSPSWLTVDVDAGASNGSTYGSSIEASMDGVGVQSLATEVGVVLVAHAGKEQVGAELRVVVGDGNYHAPMLDPGVDVPGAFAVVGFSELAPYHAELVAADGTVLATLDGT